MENKQDEKIAQVKKNKYFCITQMLPDRPITKIGKEGVETEVENDGGLHYYCGLSRVEIGGMEVIGNEWGKDENHAEVYLTEEVARKTLSEIIEDNPFAVVGVIWR